MSGHLYDQLLSIAAHAAEYGSAQARHNPKPIGQPYPGSGTDTVLRVLRHVAPASLPTSEIRRRTGLGRGCVAWALRFLEHTGRVEAVQVTKQRGPGVYLRYRVVVIHD
jgi:hypothetical protein